MKQFLVEKIINEKSNEIFSKIQKKLLKQLEERRLMQKEKPKRKETKYDFARTKKNNVSNIKRAKIEQKNIKQGKILREEETIREEPKNKKRRRLTTCKIQKIVVPSPLP